MLCPKCSGSPAALGKHALHDYQCKDCGHQYSLPPVRPHEPGTWNWLNSEPDLYTDEDGEKI